MFHAFSSFKLSGVARTEYRHQSPLKARYIELALEVLFVVAVEQVFVVALLAAEQELAAKLVDMQVPFVVLLAAVEQVLVVVHYPKTVGLVVALAVADHLGIAGFVRLDRCYLNPSFAIQKQ